MFGVRYAKTKFSIIKALRSKDATAVKAAIFTILMDGVCISALFGYFIGFSWINIPMFGAGWFFLKRDGLSQLKQLLSSINLIKIGK